MRFLAQVLLTSAGFAAAGATSAAHPQLAGDPPFTRLVPDIEVYPQNFGVTQGPDGMIYVGNSEGVLVYGGARWRLVALPNEQLARSLAHDGAARVYVGGYDAFGWLERDATGREAYHDLAARFAAELKGELFADIWRVHVTPQAVFFAALRHLFMYEPATGATRLWRHQGRFGAVAELDGKTVVQFRDEGLKELVGGEWRLLPGSEPLSDLIYNFVKLPDGRLLALAADGAWRSFGKGRVETQTVPAGFPPSSDIPSGVALADGTLAMVSVNGTVLFFNPESGAWRRFQLEPGYLNEIIPADDGGLLVVSNSGVHRIDWPAAWTALGPAHGLGGDVHDIVPWGGRWAALTPAGDEELVHQGDGSARFQPRDWTGAEAWDLLALDDQRALLAESYAIKEIAGGRSRAITHNALYPRLLRRSRFAPGVILAGLESGVAVLTEQGGQWRVVLERTDMANLLVLNLIETAPGTVWLGSDRGGVWRLQFSPDYRRLLDAREFGAADGLAFDGSAGATLTQMADGGLVAATAKGFFRWTGERFETTDLDGLAALRGADEWIEPVIGPDGTRWAFSYKSVFREIGGVGAGWRREEISKAGAIGRLRFDAGGRAIVASFNAILIFEPGVVAVAGPPARPLLQEVERADQGGARSLLVLGAPLTLPQGDYNLSFRFALPDYRRPEAVRYAVRLAGLETEFSDWFQTPQVTYSLLPPGDYHFELRARDGNGRVSDLAPLALRITPHWYASRAAQAFWLLAAAGLLLALTQAAVRLRTRKLAVDKARLEELVARRTAELETVNRRLETMALNDGLTGVANRRRLDAYLDEAWARSAARGEPLSLLAIDVDRFKHYNDRHGHLNGDELLMLLVHGLSQQVGDSGLLGRYGGDEFMAVLPGMELPVAQALAESLRAGAGAMQLGTTISIGVATGRPTAGSAAAQLVSAADKALYAAKDAGRNRVAAAA